MQREHAKFADALGALKDHTGVELPHNLGLVDVRDVLPRVQIILIDPKNNSPGLYVRDRSTYQVSHIGADLNSIYIDTLTYNSLPPTHLAALLLHDAIELVANNARVRWEFHGQRNWLAKSMSLPRSTSGNL